MRIAVIHSFYSSEQPSGENIVVLDQIRSLEQSGNTVKLFSRYTDDTNPSKGIVSKIKTATSVATGYGDNPLSEIKAFKPDVIHIHNLFPNWSTNWVNSCDIPIVVTLHNFRHTCAAGTFYRGGEVCFSCINKTSIMAVRYKCYRNSHLGSIPLAIANRGRAGNNPVLEKARKIIVLSERARKIHQKCGVPLEKMELLPNFVPKPPVIEGVEFDTKALKGFGFVGRLSIEKGIIELIEDWPKNIPLHIFGSGPLLKDLRKSSGSNIHFHGQVARETIFSKIRNLDGLIFSSRAPEGAVPLTYVEALSLGLPVLAFDGNGASDHVREHKTGVVFTENIVEAISNLQQNRSFFSQNAITAYNQQFSEDSWSQAIFSIYNGAISSIKS